MFKEFKEFIRRGNMIDLAVAFVMGAAFGKVASSFINDVVMPPVGLLLGRVDFSSLYINLSGQTFDSLAKAREAGAPVIALGVFLNAVIEFLIVALAVFVVIRMINRLKSKPAPVSPTTKECPFCLSVVPLKATRCPNCTSEIKS
jgi:large conductance mechanosensitive channel